MYPVCAKSFKEWYSSNYKYSKLYYDLGKPKPFDVTLRDGLQGLSREEQTNITTLDKINMYHKIRFNYKPHKIEIGSIVSEKVLPIF